MKNKGINVRIKSRELPFAMDKDTFSKFSEKEKELEIFIKILEKCFHEVVWYIGTDFIDDRICERFMFAKSGFMEIYTIESELRAYFPTKEKAEKFKKALKNTLVKIHKPSLISKIEIKA